MDLSVSFCREYSARTRELVFSLLSAHFRMPDVGRLIAGKSSASSHYRLTGSEAEVLWTVVFCVNADRAGNLQPEVMFRDRYLTCGTLKQHRIRPPLLAQITTLHVGDACMSPYLLIS